jgi:hypothetical protein
LAMLTPTSCLPSQTLSSTRTSSPKLVYTHWTTTS